MPSAQEFLAAGALLGGAAVYAYRRWTKPTDAKVVSTEGKVVAPTKPMATLRIRGGAAESKKFWLAGGSFSKHMASQLTWLVPMAAISYIAFTAPSSATYSAYGVIPFSKTLFGLFCGQCIYFTALGSGLEFDCSTLIAIISAQNEAEGAPPMTLPPTNTSFMLASLSAECIFMAAYVLGLNAAVLYTNGALPTPMLMAILFQLWYNIKNGLFVGLLDGFSPQGHGLTAFGKTDRMLIWPILTCYMLAYFGVSLP